MRAWVREYWNDLLDFWKTQIAGFIVAVATLTYLIYSGQLTGRKSITANFMAVLLAYGGLLGLFAIGNAIRTVFLHDRRAYRRKLKDQIRQELGVERSKNQPSPNLVINKLDMMAVDKDANNHLTKVGDVPGFSGTKSSRTALVFSVVNEIVSPKTCRATNVNAQLRFFFLNQTHVEYVIESAPWLGTGISATIQPGKSAGVVLCSHRDGIPAVIEGSYSQAGIEIMTPTDYDVVATLSCSDGGVYAKRFHFLLATNFTLSATLCNQTSKHCSVCRRYGIV